MLHLEAERTHACPNTPAASDCVRNGFQSNLLWCNSTEARQVRRGGGRHTRGEGEGVLLKDSSSLKEPVVRLHTWEREKCTFHQEGTDQNGSNTD